MITITLIMTIINSLILVAFLVLFFSIKDAHEETMLYITKNNQLSEDDDTSLYKKLEEDISQVSKRIDNMEVKPLHNSSLIEQLKSEIVQLKNELLLDDTEEVLIKPTSEYDEQEGLDMDKIWDRFKKDKRNWADREKRKLVKSLLKDKKEKKEKKEKKKKDKRKDNKGRGKKKFEWTDKMVSDFANNYNTKSIDGCENVKDKVEYYKQINK